jgi:hypothetical protein
MSAAEEAPVAKPGPNPLMDYERIYRSIAVDVFPAETRAALVQAVLHTFAVPSVSAVLADTAAITTDTKARLAHTGDLLGQLTAYGLSDPRSRAALRAINRAHAGRHIANEDYLYVLAAFIVVPTRWIQRHGHRPLTPHERAATYMFYRELGRRMGIKAIPASYEEFESFYDGYQRQHAAYTGQAGQLAEAVVSLKAGSNPGPRWLARTAIVDGLDPHLRDALGLALPWPVRLAARLATRLATAAGTLSRRLHRAPSAGADPRPEATPNPAHSACPFSGQTRQAA